MCVDLDTLRHPGRAGSRAEILMGCGLRSEGRLLHPEVYDGSGTATREKRYQQVLLMMA